MKGVRPVIASNGVPFLQMRSVESHSTSGREEEGRDEANIAFQNKKQMALYHGNGGVLLKDFTRVLRNLIQLPILIGERA